MNYLKGITEPFFIHLKDNMKMHFYILQSFILLLYGCKGEELGIEYPVAKEELPIPVVWQIPLNEDTIFRFSIPAQYYNHGILFSEQNSAGVLPMHMRYVNSETGAFIWETNSAFETDCTNPAYIFGSGSYVYNNFYATVCNSDPRVVDLSAGTTLWHYECPKGRFPNITHMNNILFCVQLTGFNPFSSGSIVKTDITTGVWDTIFTIDTVDAFSVGIYPPAAEINANNDTLIYFQNRQYRVLPYEGKIDLYGYNITKDTLIWKVENIDPQGNSSIFPPYIYEDKLFFKGAYTMFCVDTKTGNIIWEKQFTGYGEDLLYGNILLEDNKLIVKTSYESIYALEPNTGNVIWKNEMAGATPTDMEYFNGVIYYGSFGDLKLHAIDINDGKQLWEMESPNRNANISYGAGFNRPVAIDPILNRLYTSDGYYLICFQLKN